MRIRLAVIDDVDAMAAIIASVAEEGSIGSEPPVDVPARADRFRKTLLATGADALWVLEHDSRIVGMAGVEERHPGVLYLGMSILPQARGRGGGRALLRVIEDHAARYGAHKIDLEVWVDNARAIALYASAGYVVEGVRREHYRRRDGELRSALIMARFIEHV